MDKAPFEIWQNIFSLACRDSGRTGRALSLASKSFRDISAPVKLQSIAIKGSREITAFAHVLNTTSIQLRQVRFLHIYWSEDPDGAGGLVDESNSSAKELQEILNAVKDSLEILELLSSPALTQQFDRTHPIQFTRLTDLEVLNTITFTTGTNADTTPIFSPCHTLRRLHVSDNWACDSVAGADLIECISRFAPHLTHLQFSTIDTAVMCLYLWQLPAALGHDPMGAYPKTSARLPGSLKKVVVRIWKPAYDGFTRLGNFLSGSQVVPRLRRLETEDDRFFFWKNDYVKEREESRWQRHVDGGEEEWVAEPNSLRC